MENSSHRTESTIHNLVEDCLIHIFNFLPLNERTRSERVCKQWQQVIRNNSCLFRRRLEIGTETGSHLHNSDHETRMQLMKQMLKAHGKYLQEISYAKSCQGKDYEDTLELIADYCPELKSIDLRNLRITAAHLDYLGKIKTKIVSLSISESEINDQWSSIFKDAKQLRHLSFKKCYMYVGQCLEYLEPNVLQSLTLEESLFTNDIISKVANFAPWLQELNVAPLDESRMDDINKLVNLQRLKLDTTKIREDVEQLIKRIAHSCTRIEHIDVTSKADVSQFLEMPKLRKLVLQGNTPLPIGLFRTSTQIEELRLSCVKRRRCGINASEAAQLLQRSPKLRIISFCDDNVDEERDALFRDNNVSIDIRKCECRIRREIYRPTSALRKHIFKCSLKNQR